MVSRSSLLLSFVAFVSLTSSVTVIADEGQMVYAKWCVPCHADSPFAPGTIQLRATRGEEFAVLEQRGDLTATLLRTLVRSGFAGMPKFRRTEISESDLNALVNYLVKK